METEILNIDFHTRRLLLKALNRAPNKKAAGKLLGISEKTLYRYLRHYDIVKDDRTGAYKTERQLFITQTFKI